MTPLPEYPLWHTQMEVSVADPRGQVADCVACTSQVLHNVQINPVPKYPALQVQYEESYGVKPVQDELNVACLSQLSTVLHGEQLVPVP